MWPFTPLSPFTTWTSVSLSVFFESASLIFAPSFEGELSQLRFYEKPLNVLEVRNNFFVDCGRYCRPDTFGGAQIVQPDSSYCNNCGETYQKVDTPEEVLSLNISASYLPGSIICVYTAITKNILAKDITVPFINNIYFKDGTYEQINSSIKIKAGKNFGTITVVLDDYNFEDLSDKFEINHLEIEEYKKVSLTSNIEVVSDLKPEPPKPPKPATINSIYYGKIKSLSYINSELNNFNKIDVKDGRNIYINLPEGLGYGYILISKNISQPTMFRNSNESCAGFIIPMVNLGTTTINDINGNSVIYNIYRTFVATKADVDVWLCD